ncbi:MAG: NAD(P)/FAD-dependent oxidoreductase [Pseudomonadales bacterium]
MRVAVVGSGISGLSAAYYLSRQHEVTLFEAAERLGGHTATIDVSVNGNNYAIDTGFIVYNSRTYPNFIRLLTELGVSSQTTEMSFSVSCAATGLEYGGSGFSALFAQRRNLISPYFLRLLLNIVRFNRNAVRDLQAGSLSAEMSLGAYLSVNNYASGFVRHYLTPMAAAIWSSSTASVLEMPVLFFVKFFRNHGLLQLRDRPQWYSIIGGSSAYIAPMSRPFAHSIRLNAPVSRIKRSDNSVTLTTQQGEQQSFDELVLATHSDQALAILADPSMEEEAVLSAITYQANDVVLHTDATVLPRNRKVWSSWNYSLDEQQRDSAVLNYNMNILQNLNAPETFCVTLNKDSAIASDKILGSYRYSHPLFDDAAIHAQQQWPAINGVRRTWYCGAWWGNGFHEDGVTSALRVARGLGVEC